MPRRRRSRRLSLKRLSSIPEDAPLAKRRKVTKLTYITHAAQTRALLQPPTGRYTQSMETLSEPAKLPLEDRKRRDTPQLKLRQRRCRSSPATSTAGKPRAMARQASPAVQAKRAPKPKRQDTPNVQRRGRSKTAALGVLDEKAPTKPEFTMLAPRRTTTRPLSLSPCLRITLERSIMIFSSSGACFHTERSAHFHAERSAHGTISPCTSTSGLMAQRQDTPRRSPRISSINRSRAP